MSLYCIISDENKHGSYTRITDIMLVASRSKERFVGYDAPDTTAIGFTTCFRLQVQRQHEQHP